MVVRANHAAEGIGGHLATFASSRQPVRGRLQPLLPRQGQRAGRRPGVLPGPRRPGHLRPGLPGGPAERGPADYFRLELQGRQAGSGRPVVVPPPPADAGLLGVPDRLDGARARSTPSTRPTSTATCSTAGSPTPRRAGCGASSATASATSPRRSAPCRWPAREQLDNLIFVVNCNLQRLDGPVRGNGKIIQELEATFRGAGLERHQGGVGRQVGRAAGPRRRRRAPQQDEHDRRRRVPEVRHRGRRLHPGALLRPRPPAAGPGRAPLRRRPAQPAPRRPRLPQAVRRLQGGHRDDRPADASSWPRPSRAGPSARRSRPATRPTRSRR